MTSFSDYYRSLSSQNGTPGAAPSSKPAPIKLDTFKGKPGGASESKEPQDFLSWVTDILSRPLYSVTNIAAQGMNELEKAPESARKLQQGDASGLLGAIGNVATAGTRGFLSTEKADKNTTSNLIDQATGDNFSADVNRTFGQGEDSALGDVVKGVTGFIGDVALDPTTYLTFGGSAAAKSLAKGAKVAEEAAEGGARIADDVVEAVAPTPTPASAAEKLTPTQSREAVKVAEASTKVENQAAKIADTEAKATAKEVSKVPVSVREQLRANPAQAEAADSLLKMLNTPAAQKATTSVADLEKALDTTMDDYLDTLELNPKYADKPVALGNAGEDILGRDARRALETGGDDVKLQLDEGYSQFLKEEAKRQKIPTARAYESPRALFDALLKTENGRGRLETILGPGVVNSLATSTKNFDSKVQEMLSVFDEATGLDNIVSKTQMAEAQRLLGHMGIDAVGTNRAIQKSQLAEALARGEFTPEEAVVRDAIVESIPAKFDEGLNETLSPFQTNKQGTRRSSSEIGEGRGVNVNEINQYNQWNLRNKVVDGAKDILRASGRLRGSGAAYARTIRDASIPLLKASDDFLTDRGFFLNMGVSGKVNRMIPLSAGDVYRIAAGAGNRLGGHLVDTDLRAFWNAKTLIPETNVFDAMPIIHSAAEAGRVGPETREAVRAALSNTRKRNARKGDVENPANNGGHFGYLAQNQLKAGRERIAELNESFFRAHPELRDQADLYSIKLAPGKSGGSYVAYPAGRLKEDYLDVLLDPAFTDELVATVNANRAARIEKLGADVSALTQSQLEETLTWLRNPNIVAEGIRDLGSLRKKITETAIEIGASTPAAKVAEDVIKNVVGETVVKNATRTLAIERKLDRGEDIARERLEMAEDGASSYMDDIVPEQTPFGGATVNVDDPWELYGKTQAGFANALDGLARRFNPRHGRGDFYELSKRPGAIADAYMATIGRQLAAVQKAHGGIVFGTSTKLAEAFRTIQHGDGGAVEELAEAVDGLRPVINELFDVSGDNALLGNAYIRGSGDVDEINDIFGFHGLPNGARFDADAAAATAAEQGISFHKALADQWRTWDIEDPVDFLHRAHASLTKVAMHTTLANSLKSEGLRLGFASNKPQKGLVRLVTSGRSPVIGRLPEDIYFTPEAANWIHRFDETLRESKRIQGGFGDFLYSSYMPVQQAWKSLMTIYRPGHHLRNLLGDSSATWFAEGNKAFARSSRDAFKVLAHMSRSESFDFRSALQQVNITELPKAGDTIVRTRFKDITVGELENLAYRLELRPSYRLSEDLFQDQEGVGFVSKLMNKVALRGTKAEEIAGGISQHMDHYGRMQHFLQILHKNANNKKFRTIEELYTYAQKRVIKYHPQSSELTAFERKFLTPIIPFYTWARGILPAVAETILMNPGRVNSVNKASYNAAIAAGLDPYSLDDPFPEDQLFPSFLKESSFGPQWGSAAEGYWGVEPGFMIQDVLNSYSGGGNPVEGIIRGAAGSVSPLLRTPVELLTGGQVGTGAPINDTSDYLDSQIPFVNYLSNLTGRSVTGGFEEQYQVEKGNKQPKDQVATAINWLTGAGLSNYSRENFINYAEIEKRNREKGVSDGW